MLSSQLPDEPAEQFIASLYNLAADCNFGDLKDQLIRDKIVAVGIRNQAGFVWAIAIPASDPELTLEKAKTLVRQREAIRDQQQFLKPSSASVATVKSTQKYTGSRPNHMSKLQKLEFSETSADLWRAKEMFLLW